MYRLTLRRQAVKALRRMPRQDAGRIQGELDKLAKAPDRKDLDIARLKGRSGYRMRVGGVRLLFERDDEAHVIDVLRIAPRGDAYKHQGNGTP